MDLEGKVFHATFAATMQAKKHIKRTKKQFSKTEGV